MQRTKYKLEQNLIIKKPVPIAGIICSNPKRAERIVSSHLSNAVLLDEYQSAWPLDIYIGSYRNKNFFVASVPVGAAGAAFAIQQLYTAGAKYIIRYGSNDDPNLTKERMNEIIIVDQADNLYGLMQSSGAPQNQWGKKFFASELLISTLQQQATLQNFNIKLAICHHVEDYAACSFPHYAGEYKNNIIDLFQRLESSDHTRLHSRDMETAALFYRAELDGFHAATVLQNIPKFAGFHQTYDGEQGDIAKRLEQSFCDMVFNALYNVTLIKS